MGDEEVFTQTIYSFLLSTAIEQMTTGVSEENILKNLYEHGARPEIADFVLKKAKTSVKKQESSSGGCCDLYLELMRRCLINTIYEDPPLLGTGGGNAPTYDTMTRMGGGDWPSVAHSMIGMLRMLNIQALATSVIVNHVPGDFIETGVWRGGSCIFMRAILKAFEVTDRVVWVADSFQGIPPPNTALYPDDASFGNPQDAEELKVSRQQVQANFQRYGLLDDQVKFIEGWFSDTLPNAPIEQLAILRLDGDLYESTIVALDSLYDKLSVGGFVIVDDYFIPACRKAVATFRKQRRIEDVIHDIDGLGSFWQKSAP